MDNEQNESNIILPNADNGPDEAREYDMEKGTLKTNVEALLARLGLNKTEAAEAVAPEVTEGDPVQSPEPTATEAVAAAEAELAAEVTAYDPAKEDWSKFDLDENIAHLYPKSQLVDTGEGFVYVAPQVEFHISSHNVNKNLAGSYITSMVNGREQWQLSALVPNGSGLLTVVLMRQVRVKLPHPVLLETETVVAPVTDSELQATEDAGLAWAGQEVTPEQRAVLDAIAVEAEQQGISGKDFGVEGADVQADA